MCAVGSGVGIGFMTTTTFGCFETVSFVIVTVAVPLLPAVTSPSDETSAILAFDVA